MHYVVDEPVEVQQASKEVKKMQINRIVSGWCSICLRMVDKDHPTNCMIRCRKCQQEGHKMAGCNVQKTGGSDN